MNCEEYVIQELLLAQRRVEMLEEELESLSQIGAEIGGYLDMIFKSENMTLKLEDGSSQYVYISGMIWKDNNPDKFNDLVKFLKEQGYLKEKKTKEKKTNE